MLRKICIVTSLAALLATPIIAHAATVESCRVDGKVAYACVETSLPKTGNYTGIIAFSNISGRDVPDFLLKGLPEPKLFEISAYIEDGWKNLGVWRLVTNVPDYMCFEATQALSPSYPKEMCEYFRIDLGSK